MSAVATTATPDTSATKLGAVAVGQRTAARIAGLLYLLTNVTATFAFYVRGKLIVLGDAAQTARNVAASEWLFRVGVAAELITVAGVIVLLWALYVALKPVGEDMALLAAFLRLGENFTLALITLQELAVLAVLRGGATYLQGLGEQQLQGVAYASFRVYFEGFNVGFLFLGLGSALFSYLWLKSRYIPRALAAWGVFSSALMAAMSLAVLVSPGLTALGLTYMMPLGSYEVGLGLWLLFKGIKAPLPRTGRVKLKPGVR